MLSKSELEEQKQERLGEIRKNKDKLGGYKMKIIEYNGADNVLIEFQDKYKAKIRTQYTAFRMGNIKNPYHPIIYDIGYIGQGKYLAVNYKKAYNHWRKMLQRCYDPYYINKHLSYTDCFVCEEWHCFQNFAKWYVENIYNCNNEIMDLDKDILIKGNKIYSPETCVFVPQRINKLIVNQETKRGEYPVGVSLRSDKIALCAVCGIGLNGKHINKHLGSFSLNRPFQAFYTYKKFKENYIKQVADEYKDLIPIELYEALYRYEVEIND